MSQQDDRIVSTLADDPEMADIVELFTDELPKRIESLESAYQSRAWDTLRTLAHQLKGAAPSYGFESIGVAAALVENLVKSDPVAEQISDEIEELISLCRRAAPGGGNG